MAPSWRASPTCSQHLLESVEGSSKPNSILVEPMVSPPPMSVDEHSIRTGHFKCHRSGPSQPQYLRCIRSQAGSGCKASHAMRRPCSRKVQIVSTIGDDATVDVLLWAHGVLGRSLLCPVIQPSWTAHAVTVVGSETPVCCSTLVPLLYSTGHI